MNTSNSPSLTIEELRKIAPEIPKQDMREIALITDEPIFVFPAQSPQGNDPLIDLEIAIRKFFRLVDENTENDKQFNKENHV